MRDFSHYSNIPVRPGTLVRMQSEDFRPTDEMFLEAFEGIDPPLLPEREARVVRSKLTAKRGRRPKDAPPLERVVDCIQSVSRSDVPNEFLELLAERLRSGKRHTQLDVGLGLYLGRKRRERKSSVWAIYDDVYKLLDGKGFVDHPILGRLQVPKDERTRSAQALKMTQDVLQKLGLHPPSLETMLNIITARNRLFFRDPKMR